MMSPKRSCTEVAEDETGSKKQKISEDTRVGVKIDIKSNFFKLNKSPNFELTQYRVDFDPETDVTVVRKGIIAKNKNLLNIQHYIFDGASLYISRQFDTEEYNIIYEDKPLKITLRRTGSVKSSDPIALQIFNLIMRDSMAALKLQNIRRNYFDPKEKKDVPAANLELFPGYLTSIKEHAEDLLLNIDVIHKFMRKDTIYAITQNLMQNPRTSNAWQEHLKKEIVGSVVLTDYTNKTYMIDDIDFSMNCRSTFQTPNGPVSFKDYYLNVYNIKIRDPDQFLLVSKATERDRRAGKPELIYLVPELSRATGLTDEMRQNFALMREISNYTRLNAQERVNGLLRFNRRIQGTAESKKILNDWNLSLDGNLFTTSAWELPAENILLGNDLHEVSNYKAEWSIRGSKTMFRTVTCTRWIFLYPLSLEKESDNFLEALINAAKNMNYEIRTPLKKPIADDRQETYARELEAAAEMKPNLILIALPTNRADRYAAVKTRCLVNHGIPCQVVVKNKTMNHKNLNSIATKIAIQINCKLGGFPWFVNFPMKNTMIVGFDVSLNPRDRKKNIGALVCTMDMKKSSAFYNVIMEYRDGNEMISNLDVHMKKALEYYKKTCGELPDRIIFYRDGCGEGQYDFVIKKEIEPLVSTLEEIYGNDKDARLAYIIVNKKTNTRFFKPTVTTHINPKPGTVIDTRVTMHNRNDFYLISQHVGQGTVAPSYYNVMFNTSGLDMMKLEILTYKLCHLYFNWEGTTRLPMVSQYAKKLAFITSQSLHGRVHENLENTLYFL